MSKIPPKYILIPQERYQALQLAKNESNDASVSSSTPPSNREMLERRPTHEETLELSKQSLIEDKTPSSSELAKPALVDDGRSPSFDYLKEIINHFPKNWQRKAELLAKILTQSDSPISINSKAEAIVNQTPVEGSSIVDLLYDACCSRRNQIPRGADVFYKALGTYNVPVYLINNKARHDLMNLNEPSAIEESGDIKGEETTLTDDNPLFLEWIRY